MRAGSEASCSASALSVLIIATSLAFIFRTDRTISLKNELVKRRVAP